MRAELSNFFDIMGTEAKVSFLSTPAAYTHETVHVTARETHMSWVFICDDYVYKLKKPVRFPYLDFSTLARREAACRAEVRLNRRLAPWVYLDAVPLRAVPGGLAITGEGQVVDWLVVMRRLDETKMLEEQLLAGSLDTRQLDRLAAKLAGFYRASRIRPVSLSCHLAEWRRRIADNRRVLSSAKLGLDFGVLSRIDRAQRRFITEAPQYFHDRLKQARLVDGHGDLRPEHVWLGDPLAVIDCLEFSSRLRIVDPIDEIAFLGIECERLGATWPGAYLLERIRRLLHDRFPAPLLSFYCCYRATLRARLAYAHLLEPSPRTPEKWPLQGKAYLTIAFREAGKIQRSLSGRPSRPFGMECR